MKGVCFEQVQRVGVRELSDPVIEQPADAIVRIQLAGLCGSDLHPFFGRELGIDAGTVMGHEFVGEVVAVGDKVESIRLGDRVCAPFTTNCGNCFYCQRGLTSRCVDAELFGWRERGVGLHGGQATMVRVPLADATLMKVPPGMSDEVALLIGDNLSTGYFAADMLEIEPDGVYAVVGCGTVGLLAIASAFRLGATSVFAIDPNESRLEIACSLGATAADRCRASDFSDSGPDERPRRRRRDGSRRIAGGSAVGLRIHSPWWHDVGDWMSLHTGLRVLAGRCVRQKYYLSDRSLPGAVLHATDRNGTGPTPRRSFLVHYPSVLDRPGERSLRCLRKSQAWLREGSFYVLSGLLRRRHPKSV